MDLYLRLIGASLRSRLQYKFDFFLTVLFNAVGSAIDFMTVAAVLNRYPVISGWNVFEIALLSGVASASYGLFRVFGAELATFERYLVGGEFDNLLLRPWPTIAMLLGRNFDFGRIGATLQGLLLIAIGIRYALTQGAPGWLPMFALLLPLAGALIVAGISLVTASIGFWIVRIDELTVFTTNAPMTAANYPISIYPLWMRRMLSGVLPVAAMGYTPLNYALGKGGAAWHLAVPFLTAGMAIWLGLVAWHFGERHYQSAGS